MSSSDEGTISVTLEAPVGSKLEVVNQLSKQAEELITQYPEVVSYMASINGPSGNSLFSSGASTSSIEITLVDKTERKQSSEEIAEAMRQKLHQIAGAKITVSASSSIGAFSGGGVEIDLYGDEDETLQALSDQIQTQLSSIKGVRQVTTSMDDQKKQVAISFNKDQIRQYGLTGAEIAGQIRSTISGNTSTTIKANGTETDVRIIYPETAYANVSNLGDISIKTNIGAYVPLSSLAKITMDGVPTSITRSDQKRYITVTCDIYGRDSGSVNKEVQSFLKQMTFPDGYSASLGGTDEMMNETFSSLIMVIILAIVLVYAVMAAQFESFINPFIIMFTIPLALTGAFILLFLLHETINMVSLLGCLVLVGIVVNNGIILIDYIDTLRYRDNLPIEEAVLKACPTRLRPVLMTALTTILAQVPVIISTDANSEMLRGMGIVVAGGLTTSTLLTLIVVPILYMYSDKFNTKIRKCFKLEKKKNIYEVDSECC